MYIDDEEFEKKPGIFRKRIDIDDIEDCMSHIVLITALLVLILVCVAVLAAFITAIVFLFKDGVIG